MNSINIKKNLNVQGARRPLLWGSAFTLSIAGITCLALGILAYALPKILPLTFKYKITLLGAGSTISLAGLMLGGKLATTRRASKKPLERRSFCFTEQISIEEYLRFRSPHLSILKNFEIHTLNLKRSTLSSFTVSSKKQIQAVESEIEIPSSGKIYLTICDKALIVSCQEVVDTPLYLLPFTNPCFLPSQIEEKIHLSCKNDSIIIKILNI